MPKMRALALACLAHLSCGDGPAPGQGSVEITAYGEAFLEEGIPASEVRDGWAVEFERFEVVIRDVEVAGQALEDPGPVDLTTASGGKGQLLGTMRAREGQHSDASFTIASVHAVGRAHKGSETKRFDLRFDEPVRYLACETTTDVPNQGVAVFQITMHADHFLYDSLVAEEPGLTFGALAAADTGDGVISPEELSATDIGALDPGNAKVENLWEWLSALARTLGHVDGEGHCHAESAE